MTFRIPTRGTSEWTFSRAFAEFSAAHLPERVHEAFIKKSYAAELVGHNSRDSTAIEAREKPLKKVIAPTIAPTIAAKRGRPKRGEQSVSKPLTRLERQAGGMNLSDMLNDLPTACDVGTKKTAKVTKPAGSATNYTWMLLTAAFPSVRCNLCVPSR